MFGRTFGHAERSLVSELRVIRDRWAHQETFSSDDADRTLDSVERLLSAVSAPQAEEARQQKLELRRLVYDEQVRSEKRKAGGSLIEAAASGALKPWREVVTPHPDVTSGQYRQAVFAADLWQVHLGQGSDEYRDPVQFFRRTYLTESLKRLLVGAVRRLSGKRVGRDAARIAEEIIVHLTSLPGAKVTVRLEVEAKSPNPIDEKVVRIVNENCHALNIMERGFEAE